MTAIEIPTPDPRALDDASRDFAEAVSGGFAVKRLIGRGGMGMVYLARDKRLERLVAIKTLPPALAKDPAVRERFLRETRTAGGMSHPNIVPIFGADEAGGHVYFVMSYVEGDSLAAHVRARGRLDARTAARYLRDVTAALAHAHGRGIIHRDVKAENILIERASDRALVTDFGIARVAEATPLTVTGQVLGTVYYVSPEQVSGTVVDARSDIYSLGVVGFLALTGRFPFDGDVASAVLVAHVTRSAPPITSVSGDVPAALATVVDRCLMKDPAHRFASAGDLLAALDRAMAEMDRPGGIAQRAPLLSDTEAHQVWSRAAELQANTGLVPRPEPVPGLRDEEKDRARSRGYGVSHVLEAAGEAGIEGRYVEHALIEHGLAPDGRAIVPPREPDSAAREGPTRVLPPEPAKRKWIPRPWVRTAREVVFSTEVEGELAGRDIERLIHVLREETGGMGHTVAKSRELAWFKGGIGNQVIVSVVPLEDRTEIRVTRGVRRFTLGAKLGAWAVSAFPLTPLAAIFFMETMFAGPDEEIGVMFGIGVGLFSAIKLGRLVARGVATRMEARVKRLGERLEEKVRLSIASLKRR